MRLADLFRRKPKIQDLALLQRASRDMLLYGIPDATKRAVVVVERVVDSNLPPAFRKIIICLN